MKVLVMGCGRIGARLAQLFDREGHTVTVIDVSLSAFARLGPGFHGNTLLGTGIDEDVLRTAGVESTDLFLAVTNHDNSNIMAAQIAKLSFRVPRVIVRIYDPDREETYHHMGLETVCPTTLISNRIYEAVHGTADVHVARVEPVPADAEHGHTHHPLVPAGLANGSHAADEAKPAANLAATLRQRFFR